MTAKTAQTCLASMILVISALAAVPSSATTAGRAPNFTVNISYHNSTNATVTEANLGEFVTVYANIGIVSGQPNAGQTYATLFINNLQYGSVLGPYSITNTTPRDVTWVWTPVSYGIYNIAVLAVNGGDISNSTNQTGGTLTILATDMTINTVSSDHDDTQALIGIDTVTITANVLNAGNKAGRANVTFKLDGSQLLGHKEVDVPAAGNANAVFAIDFTGSTISNGIHTVQASMTDQTSTNDITGNITLINPIADVIMTGMSVSPMTITIAKGAQVLVTVTASLKNNGTAAAQNFDVYVYLDSPSTKMATIAVNDSVSALATKDVTYSFNATDALALGNHTIYVGVGSEATGYWAETTVFVAGVPAVTITQFSVVPGSEFEGVNVTFTAKLFNNGTADASGLTVNYYEDGTSIGTKANVAVGKGLTFDATIIYKLPHVTVETVKVYKAKVGTSEKALNVTIKPRIPSIEFVSWTVPTGIRIGDVVNISGTVKNNGTGDATGVIIDIWDGLTRYNATAAFDLTVGSSKDFSLGITASGPIDVNHTFYLKSGTVMLQNKTVLILHTLSKPSFRITNIVVKPTLRDKQPKDSIQTYGLTLSIINNGEVSGTVIVTIKEGLKAVRVEQVTIDGGATRTLTYDWRVMGDGDHTATATLVPVGAGSVQTAPNTISCTLRYETTVLSNEMMIVLVVIIVVAIVAAVALVTIRGRKKSPAKKLVSYEDIFQAGSELEAQGAVDFRKGDYESARGKFVDAAEKFKESSNAAGASGDMKTASDANTRAEKLRGNVKECDFTITKEKVEKILGETSVLCDKGKKDVEAKKYDEGIAVFKEAAQKAASASALAAPLKSEELNKGINDNILVIDRSIARCHILKAGDGLARSKALCQERKLIEARKVLDAARAEAGKGEEIIISGKFDDILGEAKALLNDIARTEIEIRNLLAGEKLTTSRDIKVGKVTEVSSLGGHPASSGAVELKSESEFCGGYIVVKVGILNKSTTALSRCEMDLKYNKKTMLLEKVEPEAYEKERSGDKVSIGEILPGARKTTLAFHLDPLICTGDEVTALFSYYDVEGTAHDIRMQARRIDVVCPVLCSKTLEPSMLNTASMRGLFDRLAHKQPRIIILPQGLDEERAFNIVCEVVERRDVRRIRKTSSSDGKCAWYYGKTEVTEDHPQAWDFLINITSGRQKGTVEIMVATDSALALTGLLSKLGEESSGEIEKKGFSRPITKVINISDSIVYKSTLTC